MTALRDILWDDRLLIPPAIEPLSIDEVKRQRRVSGSSQDAQFAGWLRAAREDFEEQTGLQLITATRQFLLDTFPVQSTITVGRAPVQAITRVTYLDTDGVEQTLDPETYAVFPRPALTADSPPLVQVARGPYAVPGGVQLAVGASWPTAVDQPGAVQITYQAGFGDTPDLIGEIVKYALLQAIGAFHRFTEDQTDKPVTLTPLGSAMVRRQAAGRLIATRRMTRW